MCGHTVSQNNTRDFGGSSIGDHFQVHMEGDFCPILTELLIIIGSCHKAMDPVKSETVCSAFRPGIIHSLPTDFLPSFSGEASWEDLGIAGRDI